MKPTIALIIAAAVITAAINAFGQSVMIGNGKKYHEPLTSGITRCGWPTGTTPRGTNAVDCKNCIIKKAGVGK